MTLTQHLWFLGCVGVASYAQNLTGFAFSLLLTLFRSERPQLDRAVTMPTMVASLPGVLLGVLLLDWLSDNVFVGLQLLLGFAIVGCAAVMLIDAPSGARPSRRASFAAVGLLSGVLGGLFSTAGPPLVYHFYRQPMALRAVRHALVAIFTLNAAVRIALMAVSGHVGAQALWLSLEAVPMVLGLTYWMARRPPTWNPRVVRAVVCMLLIAVGVSLVVHALKRAVLQAGVAA